MTEVTTGTGLVVHNQTVCNGNMGSTLCAPGMRSYFGAQNRVRGGGLMDRNMQMSTMGMFGGRPMFGGRVVGGYGTAGLPGLGFMNEVDLENEESKEGHVEEISMDDFMETLIEALDTDADVFESDRQITSDPWFGKQKFSLGPNGIKLGNSMDIFNDIYGNPGFGMPGGMGAFGPWGGRGPFGPMGKMGPYGRGYGGGFGFPYGMGGYGGGYSKYGMGYSSPYGFSNYGPRPHRQPQGYGQPQAYGQSPAYGQQHPVHDQQPSAQVCVMIIFYFNTCSNRLFRVNSSSNLLDISRLHNHPTSSNRHILNHQPINRQHILSHQFMASSLPILLNLRRSAWHLTRFTCSWN